MTADAPIPDLDALVALLAATGDAEARGRLLMAALDRFDLRELAERLKNEADDARYRDTALSLRWSDDAVRLGELSAAPIAVALGRMAEGLTLHSQARYRDALDRFDEASSLFRAENDDAGWARAQIGRTPVCMALGRYEEALARADEARGILEQAGERLYVARLDNNLALLLEQMNRPADAIVYSERALNTYRAAESAYYTMHMLGNHALLLWRLGRVREAIAAHQEARAGYAALGATADALREDYNIGAAYLTLGHYAEALRLLMSARRELQTLGQPYLAALAGLLLAECHVCMGRFRAAVELTALLQGEFSGFEAVVESVQTLLWASHAHAGLHRFEPALQALDTATTLVTGREGLAVYHATLGIARAQLLLEIGRVDEARALLEETIPALWSAGLTVEACSAQVLRGGATLEAGDTAEARAISDAALAVARREGLDWLAARALHLRGRAEQRDGRAAAAHDALMAAVRRLDRVHARMAWDDRAAFADTVASLYTDVVSLAVQRRQPALALRYAERLKARALAEHLRGGIDVRLRVRDERSRTLIDEMESLRERYAWLHAASEDAAPGTTAVRWRSDAGRPASEREEVERIEQRMAGIWRELQAANPAYRGEVAALDAAGDVDDGMDAETARHWLARVQAALGPDDGAALLEYVALGDDLAVFVLRGGEVRHVSVAGAVAPVRRLVTLFRLNVEQSAAAASRGSRVADTLAANARGLLRRLYDLLLAPAAPLLDGVSRLLVAPHGAAHHVPFHALHDGRAYLLEGMEVSYVPCAGLIEHFAGRQRLLAGSRNGRSHEALVLACSGGGSLPHVVAEGNAVIAALGGTMLRDDAATLAALRERAGEYTVLHLAAHGAFRPDEPLFSSLRLGDGPLSTLEVFNLELHCSLATLSACETALGVEGAGDELMGLSRAFLYAGAPSLLLSLWKVEDSSTAVLMDRLYRALGAGAGKAAALRQAQLAVLHGDTGGGADQRAPYFWAPFYLIGHSGPIA